MVPQVVLMTSRNGRKSGDDFITFGRPEILEAEIEEVVACLRSSWLGTGPRVARFEAAFAGYKGVSPDRVAAVNSCTAALHISMIAAGLQPGDEVITTPLTFCATVNAIIHSGAVPVLADIDPVTMNISPEGIRRAVTSRTRAIVPVHFAGLPCDMDAVMQIAGENGLKVIEDCAHAIESTHRGRACGTLGDFGCFSFYVTKNVVTGEGGMILSRHEDDSSRARVLSLHGMSRDAWHRFSDSGYRHYQAVECGFKYNMMDIQAALGIHQLARVEANLLRRELQWQFYIQGLSGLPVVLPSEPEPHLRHSRHLFTVLVNEERAGMTRDRFLEAMNNLGIGTGVHYMSIPEHPFYSREFGWSPEDYPEAMRIGRETVSLPLGGALTKAQQEKVIESVRSVLS
jgi:dTDP-4-amino-4,6-dideoxygalactose transaminase